MGQGLGRIHYMDAMRAVLMMLGIVLHSAQVFNPANGWVIHSAHTFPLAGWLVEGIALFRMPAFFIVAGFFCLLSMQKYNARDFAVMRVERLAVPLFVCALLLNSVQTSILAGYGSLDFELFAYLANGKWMSHLWFLNHLLVYVGVGYLVSRAGWQLLGLFGRYAAAACSITPPFALITFVAVGHLLVFKVLGASGLLGLGVVAGTFDLYSIAWNAPFFVFGMVLGLRRELLDRFAQVSPALAVLVIGICAPVAAAGAALDSALLRVGADFLKLIAIWHAAALCFRVFQQIANRPSELMTRLSGASYTVYLFHHLFVIAFGIVLIHYGIGGLPGFIALVSAVTVTTLLIHQHLIAPSPVGRYLFNGIRTRNAGVVPVWLQRRHT
ncbi:MAG: acyltransferase family protein [Gammaproteobacteria bacterium]